MFSKAALFIVASLAVFVAASPVPDNAGSCNVDRMACCNEVSEESSYTESDIISLFTATVRGAKGSVSAVCSPLTVVGLGSGSSCTATPVCCDTNNFNGLAAIACTPINLDYGVEWLQRNASGYQFLGEGRHRGKSTSSMSPGGAGRFELSCDGRTLAFVRRLKDKQALGY
ncbi:fungal hydrophobin-domain-containing protein [Infundibulicybe gibba]|nr:fungal hydrophobin-domain-containing protein [Infundibulicybe gibba]